jgi:signal transduction histidine kinase/HAMP domain-containing protein
VSAEPPVPKTSRTPVESPAASRTSWWNPRWSLAARFLWLFLPLALVPISAYWFVADRELAGSEREVVRFLLDQATGRERERLRAAAAARVQELESEAAGLRQVLAAASEKAAEVLQAPPPPAARAERLESLSGGVVATRPGGASSAILSASAARSARARREVAATRALAAPFLALLTGEPGVVSLYVTTASGVSRAVPAGDVRRYIRETRLSPDFHSPTRNAAPLLLEGAHPDAVAWTELYPDVYRGTGLLVTAVRLVRGRGGKLLGEVGADWAIERSLGGGRSPEPEGDVEILFPGGGQKALVSPANGLLPDELASIEGLVARGATGDRELSAGGETHLITALRLSAPTWTYVRRASLTPVRAQVEAQARAVFRAGSQRRGRLRVLYVAVMLGLGALVVVAVRRAVEPIRRVARVADALTAGEPAPELAGLHRLDEIGRLVSAMRNLERRVRRRISMMERTHQLAGTASVMTSPEETFARLSRLVAEGIGASKCWLALWEPETRSLALTPPGHGVPDDALRGRRLTLSDRSLAVASYRTGETYVLNEALADPNLSLVSLGELGAVENIAFAPLKTEVGVLGVLTVADKPDGFDADDRAALESFADQAALLLRNARLYDELQKSYERLRDAQRNRDYFLQNVNHELRTPLTAILGWSEILAEDRPDPETMQTAMIQIRRSAQFLLTLISDLLDLSRFEEGRTKLEPEETDLAVLVRDASEPVSVMAEGKGISLRVDAPAPGAAIVRLDPVRVRQVLWNLLHNAVKFTPRGGRIDLTARADAAGAVLTVRDTGVGVDPKDLPHVFERFRQADGSSTRAYRGMGIGLSLVKAFVELHGGTVTAESQAGRGTTFTVRIPRLPLPTANEA